MMNAAATRKALAFYGFRVFMLALCLLACLLASSIGSRGRGEQINKKGFFFWCAGIFRSNRHADDEDKQRTVYNCCPPMAASPAGSKGQPDAVL